MYDPNHYESPALTSSSDPWTSTPLHSGEETGVIFTDCGNFFEGNTAPPWNADQGEGNNGRLLASGPQCSSNDTERVAAVAWRNGV